MAEAGNTRTHAEKGRSSTPGRARQESQPARSNGVADDILALQRSAGNRAVSQLLQSGAASLPDDNGSFEASNSNSQPDSQTDVLSRAAQESSQRLDASVRGPMELALGVNLGDVRVHSGTSSHAAAETLGAHAYTIGSDIYLGGDAQHLSPRHRNQLLAHEAVHTVQQGGRAVAIQGKMEVSQPGDSAEVEAENISRMIMSADRAPKPSLALGLRDQLRATPIARPVVSRVAAPLIQRHLKNDYPVNEGKFRLDLTTESHAGDKSGMKGTIKFKANDKAPDSTNIKLLQVIRTEDLGTGTDYVWPGAQATRNTVSTAANPARSVQPGWHVDFDPSKAGTTPRTAATDPDISPYYRDYWPNATSSQDGSKAGTTISEASLWDYPGVNPKFGGPNMRFTFETVAKATDTNHIFGSVFWGFTVSDTSKGTVEAEHASGRQLTTRNTDEAIKKFNEHFKNKGSSTAPK